MSLYVDKYRPKTLDSLSYHDDLTSRLRALVSAPPFSSMYRLS